MTICAKRHANSISPLTSHTRPMLGMVTVAVAGSFSLPLSRPSASAWRTAFSISRWAVTPRVLRNLRMLTLNASSFMAGSSGWGRACSLLLDRQAFLAEIDLQALQLFAVPLYIITDNGGDNDERPDDEIEDIVAAHGGSPRWWRFAR